MNSLKFINRTHIKLFVAAVILLNAADIGRAQLRIGGIELPEINRPTRPKSVKPDVKTEPTPENTEAVLTNEKTIDAKESDDPSESWIDALVSDINGAKEEVDLYTNSAERLYLVSTPLNPWLLRAVSPKAREDYAKDKKINDWRKATAGNKFDAALDALAAAAAKKLPAYLPNANNFAFRNPAMEQMIKGKLKNIATLKISKIGLFHQNWIIEKNDLGLPANRYREAYVWAKDSTDDYQYCHLYGLVVQQDYSGSGTYGATWVYLNTDTLFGCPAN